MPAFKTSYGIQFKDTQIIDFYYCGNAEITANIFDGDIPKNIYVSESYLYNDFAKISAYNGSIKRVAQCGLYPEPFKIPTIYCYSARIHLFMSLIMVFIFM